MADSSQLPVESVKIAESKLIGFRQVKKELDSLMQVVLQNMTLVENKIKENFKSEVNPEGLLT